MRSPRLGSCFVIALVLAALAGCSVGKDGDYVEPPAPDTRFPTIEAPVGPGLVTGKKGLYRSDLSLGSPLDLSVTVRDRDEEDDILLTAAVTAGTVNAMQAGFDQALPAVAQGRSPVALSLTGTASTPGEIEITFVADDQNGGTDTMVLTIRINGAPVIAPPSGPGTLAGFDPTYTASVGPGDPLDFDISAADPNAGDEVTLSVAVTGGSLTVGQAGLAPLPPTIRGPSPLSLTFSGTAAVAGDIQLTFTSSDGRGGIDIVTHRIVIALGPSVGMPTGPGALSGAPPSVSALVQLGAPLDLDVTATHANPAETLLLTATATGGSLTPAQAGFVDAFPAATSGPGPLTLSLTGAAAQPGTLELTIVAEDSQSRTDTLTLTIRLNEAPAIGPPTGPGSLSGGPATYVSLVTLADPLDFQIEATDANGDSLTFTVSVAGGSLTPAQAGFSGAFPRTASGAAPQTLSLAGTAATAGDIILAFDVADGAGGTDSVILDITLVTVPTPPAAVIDLAPGYSGTPDGMRLTWTAPGDDGMQGTAARYLLRFSRAPITSDTEFDAATEYPQTWTPALGGTPEDRVIDLTLVGSGWSDGLVHFSLKAEDGTLLRGPLGTSLEVDTDPRLVFAAPARGVSFGGVPVRGSKTLDISIGNAPGRIADLRLPALGVGGDPGFDIAAGGVAPVSVAPGQTHRITLDLSPAAAAVYQGSFFADHDDPVAASPITVAFSGIGVNAGPEIVRRGFTPSPALAGVTVTASVLVRDANSELPAIADVVSVDLDLSPVGGPASLPLAHVGNFDAKTQVFEATIDTTGYPDGAHSLPVLVTDASGATRTGSTLLVVYTGVIVDVPAGQPTIQAAIDSTANGDVVRVAEGFYSGPGNVDLNLRSKRITVMSAGDPALTTIDGQGAGAGFRFDNRGESRLTAVIGLTITGMADAAVRCYSDPGAPASASPTFVDCILVGNTAPVDGGALIVDGPFARPRFVGCTFRDNAPASSTSGGGAIHVANGAILELEGCLLEDNRAAEGGAILSEGATIVLVDCDLVGNQALGDAGRGGAILLAGGGASSATRCRFSGNEALGSTVPATGGAAHLEGNIDFGDCIFEDNLATASGGALRIGTTAPVTLDGCRFEGNEAPDGGAIHAGEAAGSQMLEVIDGFFVGNRAVGGLPGAPGRGGAILAADTVARITVERTIIEGNTAAAEGGGIYLASAAGALLEDVLLARNVAQLDGGGIIVRDGSAATPVQLWLSTIADNVSAGGLGGGLHAATGAQIDVVDSIIWGNADLGGARDVFVADDPSVAIAVSFSDIDDAVGGIVDDGLRINAPAGFVAGQLGNLSADPLFALGPWSGEYLSQTGAGQAQNSPARNAGSVSAASMGLDDRTTRTDHGPDSGKVDCGAHFPR